MFNACSAAIGGIQEIILLIKFSYATFGIGIKIAGEVCSRYDNFKLTSFLDTSVEFLWLYSKTYLPQSSVEMASSVIKYKTVYSKFSYYFSKDPN